MMIAIIKYNAGNVRSVENAIRRIGFDCVVTDDKEKINAADKVIFPGVGEASSAMSYLKKYQLDDLIRSLKQPMLGICLGQQLMCNHSEEGNTDCLRVFNANVKLFPPKELVPHMGWNNLLDLKGDLFKGITNLDNVYFVHSYYAEICESTKAVCDYILPFSAAMQKNNFYATQFHPEKSASVGEKILKNFLEL
ncbi:MAG: imidazole glycerol phosphate synthase, glutamine amidotransferase subunit [Bacteroidetes bacterium RIFCSPLOWO2_12_FULL_35_15]|nr:MAG: imidazole glycerol phosphate synthase, glutamine amidotransferase subunit [Bacteroidetes bacterium RIFCSPLOWO2_12_FULL_35_15]